MPIVTIKRREGVVKSALIARLLNELPDAVAKALTSDNDDGRLEARDVEIEVVKMSPDVHSRFNLQILVEIDLSLSPHLSLSPQAILERRTHRIAAKIRELVNQVYKEGDTRPKAYVWVKLTPGCQVEI